MQAVIEWSWQLLDDAQRTLLAGLTVFTGGCSSEAAVTVCSDGRHDVRLLLDELHGHSLIELRDAGAEDGPRIALAEPLREFAAQRLDPERARSLRQRHRHWWPRWARGFGPTPPLGRVRQELPNIVAALASAVADGAPEDAVHIVLALGAAFNEILLPAGGMAHLSAALGQVDDPALRSRGHSVLGQLCFEAGEGTAAQRHTELGLALAPDDVAIRARALHAAVSVRWRSTREATGLAPMLDEAAALAERSGELSVSASVDALRAFIVNVVDRDFARGEWLHRRALEKWQRLGNLHAINGGVYNLAICAFNDRRWDEALQRLEAVCHTAREHEDWEQLSDALNVLGNTRAEQRDWPAALLAYQECVRVAWGSMETHALAYGLWNLPQTLAHLRRPAPAGRLMSFAAHFWERRFGPLTKGDQPYLRRARRLVGVQVGRVRWEALWAEGAAMSLADAVRLALEPLGPGGGH
jgi:tetratricopeptide (TPR) repeat protein